MTMEIYVVGEHHPYAAPRLAKERLERFAKMVNRDSIDLISKFDRIYSGLIERTRGADPTGVIESFQAYDQLQNLLKGKKVLHIIEGPYTEPPVTLFHSPLHYLISSAVRMPELAAKGVDVLRMEPPYIGNLLIMQYDTYHKLVSLGLSRYRIFRFLRRKNVYDRMAKLLAEELLDIHRNRERNMARFIVKTLKRYGKKYDAIIVSVGEKHLGNLVEHLSRYLKGTPEKISKRVVRIRL